jgi:hypothetical protein
MELPLSEIPVAPTIDRSEKSAAPANFNEGGCASQRRTSRRTVPKIQTRLGKRGQGVRAKFADAITEIR